MSNNIPLSQVKQIPLFAELGQRDLKAVAELVKREEYSNGEIVGRQGDIGKVAYFIESGELCVRRVNPEGIAQEVGRLGPGEFFGETSLLLGEPRDATVQAVQDTSLLYVVKDDFDLLLNEHPEILKSLRMSPAVRERRRAPHLSWLTAGESIIIHTHKHVAVLIRSLIPLALMVLLVLGGFGFWYMNTGSILLLLAGMLVALIPLLLSFYLFVEHYNDTYTVTNKRIVHEERVVLVRESRDEAPLHNVQNINMVQDGWLAKIFDYGNLIVETAGEPTGHVAFRHVPHPEEIQSALFDQRQRAQAWVRAQERAEVRQALQHQFGESSFDEIDPEPSPPVEENRLAALSSGVQTITDFLHYFFPPLWHEEEETIIWRKHWIILIKQIWIPVLLVILITGGATWALVGEVSGMIPVLAAYGTLLAFLFPWALWIFDDWQNDIYQVTSSRIIDVEQRPFFLGEARREASLDTIQNISLEITSLLGRVLRYGTVTIETAGSGAFTFDHVKNPQKVQTEIFNRMEAFEKRRHQMEAERQKDELLEWFSVYDEMRQRSTSQR